MNEPRFPIDFFEFSFLVEACIPPVPIARAMFWEQVINVHYHALTPNERQRLFEWVKHSTRFDPTNEDCALFNARFDPANQYEVTTLHEGKEETTSCFLWKGKYHETKNRFIAPEYIISTRP